MSNENIDFISAVICIHQEFHKHLNETYQKLRDMEKIYYDLMQKYERGMNACAQYYENYDILELFCAMIDLDFINQVTYLNRFVKSGQIFHKQVRDDDVNININSNLVNEDNSSNSLVDVEVLI